MGKLVLRDVSITVDAVELSNHANEVEISSSKDLVETTGFGDDYKTNELGIADGSISVTFFQNFAAASVDATLWPLHKDGESFLVVIKPTSGAVSATNPSYTMTAILPEYTPMSGSVGEASTASVTFQNNGSTGIVRATS